LKLAKQLAGDKSAHSSEEAKLRSAVSRAYYAAFHKAQKVVFPDRLPEGFGSHREVIDELQRSDDPSRRQIGVEMNRLQGDRKKADYYDSINNLPRMAQDVLISVEELISNLSRL